MKLTPADAQVIDLLLDGNGQLDGTDAMKQRLSAAQRVLKMLDLMPATDPSTDLIDRTLHAIEDASNRVTHLGGHQEGTFLPPTGPMAS